jgi:hypothetical protein
MVDDLEERLTRYRVDLDDAVTADLARRHQASREAGSHDADPFPPDTDHWIRLEPAMSASVDRRRVKSVVVATLGVGAAVVAIVLVATRDDDAVNPADEPSPTVTVTVPPAPPPRALPAGSGGPFNEMPTLEPGTYFVDEIDGTPTPRIYFTIGAGWKTPLPSPSITNFTQNQLRYSSGGFIGFSRWLPSAVFSDACHWSDGYRPGPVDTVDGLVAALSEQRGWADVTGPSDISIDGYVGKALQRTAPADLSDCDIMAEYHGRLASQSEPYDYPAFQSWDGGVHEPGSIETLWVLDIDGTVVVISAMLFPSDATMTVALEGPSASDRAEYAAVLDSIRIDRG